MSAQDAVRWMAERMRSGDLRHQVWDEAKARFAKDDHRPLGMGLDALRSAFAAAERALGDDEVTEVMPGWLRDSVLARSVLL